MTYLKGSVTRATIIGRLEQLRDRVDPGLDGSAVTWAANILREGGFITNPDLYVFSKHDPDGPAHINFLTHHGLLLFRGTTKAALNEIEQFITARVNERRDMPLAEESLCFDSSTAKAEESHAASSIEGWGTW